MFNLQFFAEAVQGKKIVYLYRLLANQATDAAWTLLFTTENSRTKTKDAETTETKDGSIRTPGEAEIEITASCLVAKDDDTMTTLEEAMDDDALIEIWEVNLANTPVSTNKYTGRYFQGYLTEMELTSSAEDKAELSLTFGINGSGETGEITVTDEQAEAATYAFTDTTAQGS